MEESVIKERNDGSSTTTSRENESLESESIQREGLQAWLQVLGSFCLNLNTWGLMNSYGVFQTFYTLTLLRDSSTSAISWIGSLQAFLMFLVSFLIGPVFDAGHLRPLLFTGTILSLAGFVLTSICTKYWYCMLTQGVMMGLGFGCLYLPAPALVAMHFEKNQALAIGLSATGTGVGGVIFPLAFTRLESRVGFGWATRALALIVLVTSIIPILLMRYPCLPKTESKPSGADPPSPPPANPIPYTDAPTRSQGRRLQLIRKLIDTSAFKDRFYILVNASLLTSFMGIYIILYYINLYALERTSTQPTLASNMLLIVNGASILGRTVPSALADRFGVGLVFTIAATISVILVFSVLANEAAAAMIVWSVMFGIASGTLTGLPAAAVVWASSSSARIGVRLGITLGTVGCGVLIAEPIAGAILASPGGWPGLVGWCGALLCLSSVFMGAVTLLKREDGWNVPFNWKKLGVVTSIWL